MLDRDLQQPRAVGLRTEGRAKQPPAPKTRSVNASRPCSISTWTAADVIGLATLARRSRVLGVTISRVMRLAVAEAMRRPQRPSRATAERETRNRPFLHKRHNKVGYRPRRSGAHAPCSQIVVNATDPPLRNPDRSTRNMFSRTPARTRPGSSRPAIRGARARDTLASAPIWSRNEDQLHCHIRPIGSAGIRLRPSVELGLIFLRRQAVPGQPVRPRIAVPDAGEPFTVAVVVRRDAAKPEPLARQIVEELLVLAAVSCAERSTAARLPAPRSR